MDPVSSPTGTIPGSWSLSTNQRAASISRDPKLGVGPVKNSLASKMDATFVMQEKILGIIPIFGLKILVFFLKRWTLKSRV